MLLKDIKQIWDCKDCHITFIIEKDAHYHRDTSKHYVEKTELL